MELVGHDDDFLEFAEHIKRKTGLDLLSYKQAQVRRRLTSLRDRKGYRTFAEFYRQIDKDPSVYRAFMDKLTINVTEFFRNPDRWKLLQTQILPDIVRHTKRIKCWSAACSTGEEPYSLVLSLAGMLDLQHIEVHATDLDAVVVERAREGRYAMASVKDVPPDKLKRFFRVENGQYVIAEDIKQQVRFRQHNLLSDPFDKGYDLIVCRNVTIYFTDEAKVQLYRKFAQSLKPGGYLFVGATEQISSPEQYGMSAVSVFFYRKL